MSQDDHNPTALVVEDVQEVAEIVQLFLRRLGIQSHHADSAQAAKTYLEDHRPAFIILDIGMPIVSGWEFLQSIRTQDGLNDIPVAILTAYTDPDSRNKGQALNVDAYLKKPLIFDQLKEVVDTFLKLS
jgi:CheY-like chemotaxis protein